jgi:hypothetical protein
MRGTWMLLGLASGMHATPGTELEPARGHETLGNGGAAEPLRPESNTRDLRIEGHHRDSCPLGMPHDIPILTTPHRAMPKRPPLFQPDELIIFVWEEWPVVQAIGVLNPRIAVPLKVGPCRLVHGEVSCYRF